MRHNFIDQFSDLNSSIHRLDPRSKLLMTLVFITAVVLTPSASWLVYCLYFFTIAFLILLSRVPLLYILKRSLLIIPFVLLVAVFIPFYKEGIVAISFNIGSWSFTVSHNGLQLFFSILAKSWLSLLSLILMTSTTSFTRLLKGLERLHIPQALVMLLSFMYRYSFVLTDEVMRMKQARDSRNFGGKRLLQLNTAGYMIGTLFIRSYERGERIYAAMLSRGFNGNSRTLDRLHFSRLDAYFVTGMLLVLVFTNLFYYSY
jgi:cobalt/nickel transport system permease protein